MPFLDRAGPEYEEFERERIAEWHEGFYAANPRKRKFRDLVVAHAESKGGMTLRYLKARWPYFWGIGEPGRGSALPETLGISEQEASDLFSETIDAIWAEYVGSPEYRLQPPSAGITDHSSP